MSASLRYKLLILLTGITVSVSVLTTCNKSSTTINTIPQVTKVIQKTDKQGTSFTEVKEKTYTEADIKVITDSLRKNFSGRVRIVTVEKEVVIPVVTHDTILVAIDTTTHELIAFDSTKEYKQSFKGNYKAGTGSFSLAITPDTATHIFSIQKHLFKPNEFLVSTYHTNKLFIPTYGSSYTAQVSKPVLVFGPTVGIGYNGKIYPYVGIGVTLNLISLKSK